MHLLKHPASIPRKEVPSSSPASGPQGRGGVTPGLTSSRVHHTHLPFHPPHSPSSWAALHPVTHSPPSLSTAPPQSLPPPLSLSSASLHQVDKSQCYKCQPCLPPLLQAPLPAPPRPIYLGTRGKRPGLGRGMGRKLGGSGCSGTKPHTLPFSDQPHQPRSLLADPSPPCLFLGTLRGRLT